MKAVLISIKPKWCELIASGDKTLEVRKTRPKLKTPFKCYIYETKGKSETPTFVDEEGHIIYDCGGVVIGEFVCNKITGIERTSSGLWTGGEPNGKCWEVIAKSRMSAQEIYNYAGKNIYVYGWHISELKIYDEPKELSAIPASCDNTFDKLLCGHCNRFDNGICSRRLSRPPQSWCYVEEVTE